MAVVLAYTSPALGHLFPFCALMSELAARGHDVHIRTLAGGVGLCRELGFTAHPVDGRIEQLQSDDTIVNVLKSAIDTVGVLTGRATLEVGDADHAMRETQPDVTVVDANCWGAMAVAERRDRPWLAFSPFIPYLRSPGSPPFGAGAAPRPGLLGRIRDIGIGSVTRAVLDLPLRRGMSEVRRTLGLPAVGTADELLRRAPALLVATATPFEYPHTHWGDSVELIGPMEFDPPHEQSTGWLDDIAEPLVLVTTSSVAQADHALVRTAVEALRHERVHTVVTAPAGLGSSVRPAPRVTVTRFLPHSPVLDRAACLITHGGMGVTQKALARGVPVCVVPFGRDQFEVARRVEVSRSGTRLPAGRLTASRLRDALHAAMAMTAGARVVADGFAAAGGAARGADVIERAMIRRSRGRAPC